MITAITNAPTFDGECVIDDKTVVINGALIRSVGDIIPAGATPSLMRTAQLRCSASSTLIPRAYTLI